MRKAQCPKCRATMFLEQDFGGKVTCSQCGATLTVRQKAATTPASPASVPEDDEYRIAPVQASNAPLQKAPAASDTDDDYALAPMDSGKAFAAAAPTATAARSGPTEASDRRCPSCEAAVAPGAVICVQCGYDFRQKTRLVSAKGAGAAPVRKVLGILTGQNAIPICSGAGFLLGTSLAVGVGLLVAIEVFEIGIYVFVGVILGTVVGGGIGYVVAPFLPGADSEIASAQLVDLMHVIGGMLLLGAALVCFGLGQWLVALLPLGFGLYKVVVGIWRMLSYE